MKRIYHCVRYLTVNMHSIGYYPAVNIMTLKKWYVFLIIPTIFGAPIQPGQNLIDNYQIIESATEDKILLQDKDFWYNAAEKELNSILMHSGYEKQVAKNVIIFVGDGMGVATTTAARIYKGQRNFGKMGEEHKLNFENFPNVALVKTYNVDTQVPDSAGTATALFTGVKTRIKAIGVDVKSDANTFDKEIYEKSKLDSIMTWAQKAGKYTGFVTTTRVTHATPAALYAKINHRDWESDSDVPQVYRHEIKDIARQLIEDEPGKNFKVILGGGQNNLGYVDQAREDNLNLTEKWLEQHKNRTNKFVVNTMQLEEAPENAEYLLGLFDAGHMPFDLVRNKNPEGTPSLSDMTKKAIRVLKKGPKGFVLMVEGGLIDIAHHKNYARHALAETAELDNAVSIALDEVGPETLILVTSDHSHAFTINGYAKRGNDILGFGNETSEEMPYLTLAYGNGPGFNFHYQPTDPNTNKTPWRDISKDVGRSRDPWYPHLATFFREDETHGGEDVPIYAIGRGSHLVKGVIEQNTVTHIISYVACIGPRTHLNRDCLRSSSSKQSGILVVIAILIYLIRLLHPVV